MKKIHILILVLIFLVFSKSYSNPFEIMPLNVHFFNCVASRQNILAYGSCGAYLMTTDKGKSWKQYSIGSTEDIMKMVNYNDTLWCITESGFVFKSINNGLSWNKNQIKLESNDNLINIEVSDNFLYLRTEKSIKQFDKSFNSIKNFSDLSIYTQKEINNFYTPEINYYRESYFKFINNKLICAQNLYKDNEVLILDENLNKIKEINTKDFIKRNIIGLGEYSNRLIDIYLINSQIVFNFTQNLYCSDESFSKWKYFYPDTNYMNSQDTLNLTKYYMYNQNYSVFNKNLYQTEIRIGFSFPFKDSLWVVKYNNIDTSFKKFNNFFTSKYSDISPESEIIPKLTTGFYWGKLNVFFDSIFIYTYYDKSLLQSTDNCKTWNLISHYVNYPTYIINDSTFNNLYSYKKNNYSMRNTIYTTFNGGTTFKPTIFKDSSLKSTQTFLPGIFYINKKGKGIFAGTASNLIGQFYYFNLAYTDDFGMSYNFKKDSNLYLGYSDRESNSTNITEINNNLLFGINNGEYKNMLYNYLYRFDFFENKVTYFKFDTLYKINYLLADNLKNFKMFVTENDLKDTNKYNFAIYETNDSGKTHSTVFKSENYYDFAQFFVHNNDLLFTCKNDSKLYSLKLKSYEIDTLFEQKNAESIKLFKIGERIFVCGNGFIYENTSKTNIKEWSKVNWDYGEPNFETVIFQDNTAIATFSDSLRKKNYYKFTLKTNTDIEENPNIEVIKYSKRFYVSDPYPLPTTSKVSTLISFDLSFDIWDAIVGIYDINGSKIEGKENITLTFESKYTAKLEWNCSKVCNGIYFIVVSHNGTNDCVPVVVEN